MKTPHCKSTTKKKTRVVAFTVEIFYQYAVNSLNSSFENLLKTSKY